MQDYVTIAQVQAVLSDFAEQLKAASGDDAFISQADLERLLTPIITPDTERAQLLSALYNMALTTETAPGGRITHSDIDRAVQATLLQIIPQYRLAPGPLSEPASSALERIDPVYANVARLLKARAYTQQIKPAAELVEILRTLVNNLYLNEFHQNDTGIIVDTVPLLYPTLGSGSFYESLAQSGNRDWEDVRERFGAITEDTDTQAFWVAFPTLQNEGPDRDRALAAERIWKSHVQTDSYFRFDNSTHETTHFVVAGVNANREIVFLLLRHLWT
jgi:hypothetical protein